MSLNLDPRQRAMLREMGIRVWQPEAPAAGVPNAIESVAAHADATSAAGSLSANSRPAGAIVTPVFRPSPPRQAAPPVRTSKPPAAPHPAPGDDALANWLLGDAQVLYADTAQPGGARWLVLAETSAAALHAPAFEGDAGKLLANMLRAARLDRAGAVLFAPLARRMATGAADANLSAALSALLTSVQPDVVLVMGRLAAQTLLHSTEPFGKLRGKVHSLHGFKTIVTHDAAYLLRTQADKAKAWHDLCLAMSVL